MDSSDELSADQRPSKAPNKGGMVLDAGYGYYSSRLRFDDRFEMDITQHTVSAGATWLTGGSWSFRAGLGAIIAGTLGSGGEQHDFLPGALVNITANWRALTSQVWRPFVDLSTSLAGSWSSTELRGEGSNTWVAIDARLGARAGWLLWQRFSPYVHARVFGGPALWFGGEDEPATGTDIYHYQIGGGLSLFFDSWGLYAEASPLGEQSYFGGASVVF